MIKLGVFYCPEGELKNNIESIKTHFSHRSQKNKYLDHLAHMSIYVFDIHPTKLTEILQEFENLQNKLISQLSKITNWRVFEKDILTSLNTLCLEIELTNDLYQLQEKIVKTLSKFHLNEIKTSFKGEYKLSYEKYGYPFVGKHWVPHFTIGSLEIDTKKISKYSEGLFEFSKEFEINNLYLFEIKDDSHLLIKKIEF